MPNLNFAGVLREGKSDQQCNPRGQSVIAPAKPDARGTIVEKGCKSYNETKWLRISPRKDWCPTEKLRLSPHTNKKAPRPT